MVSAGECVNECSTVCSGNTSTCASEKSLYDSSLLLEAMRSKELVLPVEFEIRPLMSNDYDRGFLNLLSQLTTVGTTEKEDFEKRFNAILAWPGSHFVTVIVNSLFGIVVGSATLVIEQKFIHSSALRGRIEDVVVDDGYRGLGFGNVLLNALTEMSRLLGVYKITLECKDVLVPFYSGFGYKKDADNNYMVIRYKS